MRYGVTTADELVLIRILINLFQLKLKLKI